MAEYTLSNSAAIIDSAITRVASADDTPVANSQNMVTSAGVKTYVDTQIPQTIEASRKTFDTGYADISLSGTASSDGFILAQNHSTSGVRLSWLKVVVGGVTFEDRVDGFNFGYNRKHNLCVPIAAGESYAITNNNGTIYAKFKSIS